MKRHCVEILTATDGRTFACCQTCGRKSKQGTKPNAVSWQAKHIEETSKP